jgi:NADH-quinone oxidoreductase subunit I
MPYKASLNPTEDFRERIYLPELLRGLALTTRHFLRNLFGERDTNTQVVDRRGTNLISTVSYPEERIPYPPGYRGLHRLVPRADGRPRCVACYMCASICPAQCIYIEAGEYDVADPVGESRVIEKFPTTFVIDELRCIVCGLCVEACPKDAIRMDTYTHAPSEYNRQGFVWDIPKLLQGPPVAHPSDPWTRRDASAAPAHAVQEAHARIGAGDMMPKHLGRPHGRTMVTDDPIPVTKFFK